MSTPSATSPFTEPQREALGTLAGLIIPASQKHGLPGADDPQILATILSDAAGLHERLTQPLTAFGAIEAPTPKERGAAFRQAYPDAARMIQTLVAQCYYRDNRVMRSLAIEMRPPFPQGYQVEQGDWSVLDPVRASPPIYRATD